MKAVGEEARLTVTHSNLQAGSAMQRGIAEGWPAVLSSMKTLLETGRSLAITRQCVQANQ